MRGRIGMFMHPSGLTIGKERMSKLVCCAPFSSSGSGGRGRGRGVSIPTFVVPDPPGSGSVGAGHGRGNPSPSKSFVPSFVAPNPPPGTGRGGGGSVPGIGRGKGASTETKCPISLTKDDYAVGSSSLSQSSRVGDGPVSGIGRGKGGSDETKSPSFLNKDDEAMGNNSYARAGRDGDGSVLDIGMGGGGLNETKSPIFLKKDDDDAMGSSLSQADFVQSVPQEPIGVVNLPETLSTSFIGYGRGKPGRNLSIQENDKGENRHLRPRRVAASPPAGPKLSREEAVKMAIGVLSRDEAKTKTVGKFEGRRKFDGYEDDSELDSDEEDRLLGVGNDADAEKLATQLGPSKMAELSEALDDMLEESVPTLGDDEYLEAYDTNLKIELEPEYLMADFETNPDINENPPIPLREALEKMKPFLMAYEGIENQEEWEEIVEDTMERVPLMKEIVDHYCGPDRVTAKQQHEELVRVANTLPVSELNSVKRFTDRAVLSLQGNPGWGFHRKWQFMDKLVGEFSKCQK